VRQVSESVVGSNQFAPQGVYKGLMGLGRQVSLVALAALLYASPLLRAQDAKQIVQEAVNAELAADRNDRSHWRYVETEMDGSTFALVETVNGAVKRHIEENHKPASAATLAADDEHNRKFAHDPGMQQKQRRDGAHDERDAEALLNLLPVAFTWKLDHETGETATLSFMPDPKFSPPDMEARVMGEMAGTLIVDKKLHRIVTMKGALSEDVNIGFGILGRLRKGGTFDIERREVAPGNWQITEAHVHIEGRALFFKSIGEQQDEVKFNFKEVPDATTLDQAVALLPEMHK